MITDTLKKVCLIDDITAMNDVNCGFRTLSRTIFHALGYFENRHDKPEAKEIIFNLTKGAYGIHLWNYITRGIKFNLRNDAAMATFTKKSCPQTHSQYETI